MSTIIPLSKGYVTVVDDEDAHFAHKKWHDGLGRREK
jgi:hypothetical protein